jgi:hypothetical protein
MLDLVMKDISKGLRGAAATADDIDLLRLHLGVNLLPEWFVLLLQNNRLAGVEFSLEEGDDMSRLGAEVFWLAPAQVVSESTECQPGLSVVPLGYIPVGACAEGSGDPYFLDMREGSNDPPLVRVPHEFAVGKPYPLDRIELVTETLSAFFSKASS